MTFSEAKPSPPQSTAFMPPYPGGDVSSFWGQYSVNPEQQSDTHSQHETAPPLKRMRNFDSMSNSEPLTPMNPPNSSQGGVRGTSNIFYKTRMCAKFMGGTCRNGEHCSFAHGAEDLREPPPNWQELVREKDRGSGNWNEDNRIMQRMKLCKRYYNGEDCPYGEKCTFLHERPLKFRTDIARQRESSAISIGTTGSMMGTDNELPENKHVNSNSEAFRVKPVFWKTKMCTKWEITGQCPFGERCHYAHGQSELHVPSGTRVETEAVMKSIPVQMKHLSNPVLDASSPAGVLAGGCNNGEQDKKISRWKLTKKINRIYGDWLEGFTPPHELPSIADA